MKLKLKYKYLALALLLCCGPMLAFALKVIPTERWLKAGNAQYARAQYPAAIASYRKVLNAGVNAATVYYNLGNACYKNGDIAWSVYYYEKAHKIDPTDDDVNTNLQFARLKTADKIDQSPQFFITRWWHGFILSLPLQTLAVLSIVFILLACGGLIWYLFASSVQQKKNSFYGGLSLLAIGLIFVFMGNRQSNYFNTNKEAIIFSPTVSAKAAPSAAAKSLFVLHDGTKVTIAGKNEGWLKVKLTNGSEGWVQTSAAKKI